MFEKIDKACLRLAEKASKWYSWLTGKDNFEMARGVLKIFCAYLFALLVIMAIRGRWEILEGIVDPLVPFFIFCSFLKIRDVENKKSAEQQGGIKNMRIEIGLRRDRAITWTMNAISLVIFHAHGDYHLGRWLLWQPFSLSLLIVSYLQSIDRPPYSSSQARDWLKSFFTARQATPVPVPTPSRPS
ncbi:MAG: hypothetical protein KGJ89_03145 [Patescibacteria group bacterium]|nr:hypothetical protein [Patescibacteria group bacterium]MDE2015453.1 hypothetical protein [Patescibacteria group bacterium]MDE2226931.1 hypothetical protein [Patescibacteria group bacterium]